MSGDSTFVDTNVLVYAYDTDAADKHDAANRLLGELWDERSGAVSTQVLQEFYVTVTRKLPRPLSRRDAREVVQTYSAWDPHQPTIDDLIAASDLEERHRLSVWNALIVVSAQRVGTARLVTEDLEDGQRFGSVTVLNPFSIQGSAGRT